MCSENGTVCLVCFNGWDLQGNECKKLSPTEIALIGKKVLPRIYTKTLCFSVRPFGLFQSKSSLVEYSTKEGNFDIHVRKR